ncbi:root hair specific 17 [Prunus dulcis]|uniref:O-fucosyltransferase family protein n=1 Tax=Prunus dulcis TaxID=3755 RepID=A0A5H2XN17_PRUDU|nr:root hair specific 17 [Prunus dulcis]
MTSLLIYKTNALNVAAADVKTYLLTAISGGLNQQRRGITDAFIAAYILNATLLVLKLGQKLFWKDSSNFDEIFDVDWFISSLSKDVEIIKQLPTKGGIPMSPYSMPVLNKNIKTCFLKGLISWVIRLVTFNLGYLPGGDKTIIRVRNNTEQGIGSCKKDCGAWRSYQFSGLCGASWWMASNPDKGKVLPSVRVSDPGLLLKPDEPNLIIMAKPAVALVREIACRDG